METYLYGSALVARIRESSISDDDLMTFMQNRGIFLSEYTRENVMPILERLLLTASEYQFFKERLW